MAPGDRAKSRNGLGNGSKNGSIKLKICSPSGRGKSFHSRGRLFSTGHQNVHASFSSRMSMRG